MLTPERIRYLASKADEASTVMLWTEAFARLVEAEVREQLESNRRKELSLRSIAESTRHHPLFCESAEYAEEEGGDCAFINAIHREAIKAIDSARSGEVK